MAITAGYMKQISPEVTLATLGKLALLHCLEISDPGLRIYLTILVKEGRYAELCNMSLRYELGYTVNDVLHARQVLAYFSKLEGLEIGEDKEANAWNKFMKSEGECLRANARFNGTVTGDYMFSPDVERVLISAERKIAALLGPVPRLEELNFLFGPGATTSVRKRNACARTKLSAVPSCSANLVPLAGALLDELPLYRDLHAGAEGDVCPVHIHAGKASFAKKNAKTYRLTVTEPTLNALAQSAFGQFMKSRLLRVGVDLSDQNLNKELAREGSITGALATLDLVSASDSISIELVARLFPYDWFAALSLMRSETIVTPHGDVLHLHKFSSMGNGTTFPIESLIFWALSKSCSELVPCLDQRIGVYGDDLIVGVECVPLLIRVLKECGFEVNQEKSFSTGHFRESCGGDYYFGFPVRPCYIKDWLRGADLFVLHNFYFRSGQYEMCAVVEDLIDPTLRMYGPDKYGDGHLLSSTWKGKAHQRDRGWCGVLFSTHTFKPKYHFQVMPGDGVLPAYSAYEREFVPEWDMLDEFPEDVRGVRTLHKVRNEPDNFEDLPSEEQGRFIVPYLAVPGVRGYKVIQIYTLSA